MSGITIEEIANAIQRASFNARMNGRIQYVFFDGIFLQESEQYERSYAAKCYSGGRIELKGPIGDQVRKWQKEKAEK